MQTIRGVFDGKTIRPLATETLPQVHGEIPVEIIFLDERAETSEILRRRAEAAHRLITARETTPQIDGSVREMIEDGRYR